MSNYDYSRSARERRQEIWQAGKDWLLDSDLLERVATGLSFNFMLHLSLTVIVAVL